VLRWICNGGLLIMMGHQARSEALFYYVRLDDQIAENHLPRLIDRHISFEFVWQQLKDRYSRRSILNCCFAEQLERAGEWLISSSWWSWARTKSPLADTRETVTPESQVQRSLCSHCDLPWRLADLQISCGLA
jgi:hypothetical protein